MSGTTIGPGEMTENWQNSCLHTLGFCISRSYFREYALFSYGKRKSGRKKRKEEREREGGKEEQKKDLLLSKLLGEVNQAPSIPGLALSKFLASPLFTCCSDTFSGPL